MAGRKRKVEDPVEEKPVGRRTTRQTTLYDTVTIASITKTTRSSSSSSSSASASSSSRSSSSKSSTPVRSSSRVAAKPTITAPSAKSKKSSSSRGKSAESEEDILTDRKIIKGKAKPPGKDDKIKKELSSFDTLLASVTKDNEYHELETYVEEVDEEEEELLNQVDSIADDIFDVKDEIIETIFTKWKKLPQVSSPMPENDVYLKLASESHYHLQLLSGRWVLSTFNESRLDLILPWLYETAVYSPEMRDADIAFKTLVTLLTGNTDYATISPISQRNILLEAHHYIRDVPEYFSFNLFMNTFKNFGLVLPKLTSSSLESEPESRKPVARGNSVATFPSFNFEIALNILRFCGAEWPSMFSIEELNTLSQALCLLLIDPTVSKSYLQVSSCLCQILRCYPDDQWDSLVKDISKMLLSMKTKNYRVYLANRIPIVDRGRKLQLTMAGLLLCELLDVDEKEWDSKTDTIEVLLLFFSKVSITRSTDPVYYTNLLTYLSLMDLALDKGDIVRHHKKAKELKAKFQFAKDKIATLTHLSILLTKEQLSKFVTLFIVFLPQKSIIDPEDSPSTTNPKKKTKTITKKNAPIEKQMSIETFFTPKRSPSSPSFSSTSTPPSSSPLQLQPSPISSSPVTSSSISSSPINESDVLKPRF